MSLTAITEQVWDATFARMEAEAASFEMEMKPGSMYFLDQGRAKCSYCGNPRDHGAECATCGARL